MKRIALLLVIASIACPVALFARSNHAGWHGAAPVKRSKHGKQKTLSPAPGGTYGI